MPAAWAGAGSSSATWPESRGHYLFVPATLKPGQRTVFALESGMEACAEVVAKRPLSIRAEKHGLRRLLGPMPPHPQIFKE